MYMLLLWKTAAVTEDSVRGSAAAVNAVCTTNQTIPVIKQSGGTCRYEEEHCCILSVYGLVGTLELTA